MELLVFLKTLGEVFWLYKREKPGYESLALFIYTYYLNKIFK